VARRATAIKDARNSTQNAVLLLDAGSTLTGQKLAILSQGQVVVEAMNALGYDAMTVGRLEMDQGLENLQARAKEASFSLLSCNIAAKDTGALLFQPYTVIKRNGARFGILGVSESDVMTAPGADAVIKLLDATESVRKYLPELRKQSDVVILLSRLGLDGNKILAGAVQGIDVIVNGGTKELLNQPETVGGTVIVSAGYDGEWLGRLDATVEAPGKTIGAQVQIVTLGPEIADDPELAALVATYNQKYP
jgi:2',3'-cyclic-nucleotide 2'-phosphodiesterase (5'-nucleotidase family)